DQLGPTDQVRDRLPAHWLDDDVDVVVGATRRALHGPARLSAARGVTRSRDAVAEVLVRVFAEWSVLQPLVIAQLDAAQVQHRVLHRYGHALPATSVLAPVQGGQDAGHGVDAGARVPDLGTGGEWRAVFEPGRAHRAAHRLGDHFVRLVVG